MPRNNDCVTKHRDLANVSCADCSEPFSACISGAVELKEAGGKLLELARKSAAWAASPRTEYLLKVALYETCANAIEHGILGYHLEEKKALQSILEKNYPQYILRKWKETEERRFIKISLCVNAERILLGVHDKGSGFDPLALDIREMPEARSLDTAGRGLFLLKGLGISLKWNEKGNSILCTIKREGEKYHDEPGEQ